ncbi:WD40 domain-containing protein [Anatilimnocola floriformis]|uniref:WD40 domain-containing protein n=1 Tax=Anatilimnocola floriformis TaxID=2948575 RepID=UPI0020C3A883|nr:SHD1 domain-containing protein [Anatilimnocola floriformis]
MNSSIAHWLLLGGLFLLPNVSQAREWQDATGAFKVEADLLGVVEDRVKLQKPDGSTIEVPLAKLSAKDQTFVKEWQTAKPQVALIAKLSDKEEKMRRKVLYDLMELKLPVAETLPHLIRAAEDSDLNLADPAMHYLSEMGTVARPALPALERIAARPDKNGFTMAAEWAIFNIRYRLQHFGASGAEMHGMAVLPDGKSVIASGTGRGESSLNHWDLTTGKLIREFKLPDDSVGEIALTGDGKQLAVANDDKIQILDPSTGNVIRTLTDHAHTVGDLAWNRDQTLLASTDDDKQVLIHDAEGKLVKKIAGHRDTVTSLIFMPGGKRVVTASVDGSVISWEIATGKPFKEFKGYTGTVGSLAVRPDTKWLAAGSSDGSVTIWESFSGKLLKKWQAAHEDSVSAVIFSPDNQWLLTSGENSVAKVWDASTGKLITDLATIGHVQSWSFDNSGDRLFCGAMGYVSVLDWKELKTLATKK